MTKILTSKQQTVLKIIKNAIKKNGTPPSLRELQQALSIKTKRGVVNHLKALEKKGMLKRTSEARGIRLMENIYGQLVMDVKILGFANAGSPLMYANEQNLGVLRIEKSLLPVTSNIFALEIKGDSMNRKLLNGTPLKNSNFAIVAKDQNVQDGDVVLAIIDDCATIKSFKSDRSLFVLYPESTNKLHKPIYLNKADEAVIFGKVIAVLENPIG